MPVETTEKYDSALMEQAFIFKVSENGCTSHCSLCLLAPCSIPPKEEMLMMLLMLSQSPSI